MKISDLNGRVQRFSSMIEAGWGSCEQSGWKYDYERIPEQLDLFDLCWVRVFCHVPIAKKPHNGTYGGGWIHPTYARTHV